MFPTIHRGARNVITVLRRYFQQVPYLTLNLSCFPAAFLRGRDAVALSIKYVLQSAFAALSAIWCQWAHGQQDLSVWVTSTLVMKGNVSMHVLIHK